MEFYNNAQTHGSFPPKSCIKSESLHLLLFPIILVLNLVQNSRNSNTLLLTSSDILHSGLFGFLLLNFSFLCSERYKSFRHWLHRCSFSLQRIDMGWFYFFAVSRSIIFKKFLSEVVPKNNHIQKISPIANYRIFFKKNSIKIFRKNFL